MKSKSEQECEAKEQEFEEALKDLDKCAEDLDGKTKILKKKNGTRKNAKQRTG